MYDNIDFKLRRNEVSGIDFLSETPCFFNVTGEHRYGDDVAITGTLDEFKITVMQYGVNVTEGSLCKYYLGDNFQTLGRSDTQKAIEQLSDTLHLPIDKASISRIDVSQNFIVKQPIENYFNHLGELRYYRRAPQDGGSLYYFNPKNILLFYDKVKEQKEKGYTIPELYEGRNTLRYETRYKKRLPEAFKVERVTGAMLYNEVFYTGIIDRWRDTYKAIKKVNNVNLNFKAMKGKRDFDILGRLCLIEQAGGELAVVEQINEAYRAGTLSRRQADELKKATREACQLKQGITERSDLMNELDKKINEACKFYR